MSVRFVLDAQLPPGLMRVFYAASLDCEHVFDVGLGKAKDPAIWDYAVQHQAIIVSKDEDFAARKLRDPNGPQIVWLRIGNCSNAALRTWMQRMLPLVIDALRRGDELVEVV